MKIKWYLTRAGVRPARTLMVVFFVTFCFFSQCAWASITTLKPAPVFSAITIEGKTVNLAAQKGKTVVLHFWSDRAPAGEGGMPYMQRLSTDPELVANGVIVWAVADSDRTRDYLQNYAKSHRYTFDILYDNTGALLKAYDVASIPSTVVIGPDGIVRRYVIGWGPQRMSVDNAIQEILGAYKGPGGKAAPQISLTTIDGQPTNLARQNNKVVLIHFWSPDDSLSRQSLSYIQELAANAHFAGEGLVVWTVAESQTPQALKEFLRQNKYTFSTIDDSNHATMQSYGVLRIPTTILVGKDGTIRAVNPGWLGRRDARVANSVDQALTGLGSGSGDRLVGRHAPPFSLDSLDGKAVTLASQRGKVVVLDFWNTWSTPGQWALPHLQQLATDRGSATNGLVVWGIAVTDSQMSEVSVGRYLAAKGYTFTAAYDAQHAVQSDYCDRVSGSEGNLLGQDAVGGTYVVGTMFPVIVVIGRDGIIKNFFTSYGGNLNELVDHAVARSLAEPPDSSDSQSPPVMASIVPAPVDTVRPPPSPTEPAPSSPPAPQATDPLASTWQSDAFAGQAFHFRLNGNAIEVYGSQQEPLGVLQAKEKKGVIDVYQGLVQVGPLTQCPGGRGLMQIKAWNDSRLDARIETPLNGPGGTTCGGVMGTGRLVRWQQVTFVKN